jgi:hypothetical protein
LPSFGWEPIIITVDYRYYEERLDWNLVKLLPKGLRTESVVALPTKPIRLVGDIGIRSLIPMLFKILNIIRREKIDFLYITVPSHYASLLGRIISLFSRIKYGIDYIDPWIYVPDENEKIFSKAWLSRKIAAILEPLAVSGASLISGVAPLYYEGVFLRNPHLRYSCKAIAMPFGGEEKDSQMARDLKLKAYLFEKIGKIDLVYAGAMLPKAYKPLRAIFAAISSNAELYKNIRIHFIGTGRSPDDAKGFNVRPLAEEFTLWQKIVFEYPQRIPYLEVLAHLEKADAVFILGSTEPHYTPSKVYQAISVRKPILAVLHENCAVCGMLTSSRAGLVLGFNGEEGIADIRKGFNDSFRDFMIFMQNFKPDEVNRQLFEEYSAYNVTKKLAEALDRITQE